MSVFALENEFRRLAADLARVTAERDGLYAAMKKITEWQPRTGQGDADVFLEALCFAVEAIAACAPPASGEKE
jgi:hypothetical protein